MFDKSVHRVCIVELVGEALFNLFHKVVEIMKHLALLRLVEAKMHLHRDGPLAPKNVIEFVPCIEFAASHWILVRRVIQFWPGRILVAGPNSTQEFGYHLQRRPPMLAIYYPQNQTLREHHLEAATLQSYHFQVAAAELAIPNITDDRLHSVVLLATQSFLDVLHFLRYG